MDAVKIYNRVKELQKDSGLSNRKLCELAGVSHSVLDNWKKREVIPSVEILADLCDVLNTSVSRLLAFEENKEDLSEDCQRLLDLLSGLKTEDKKILFDLMYNMRKHY